MVSSSSVRRSLFAFGAVLALVFLVGYERTPIQKDLAHNLAQSSARNDDAVMTPALCSELCKEDAGVLRFSPTCCDACKHPPPASEPVSVANCEAHCVTNICDSPACQGDHPAKCAEACKLGCEKHKAVSGGGLRQKYVPDGKRSTRLFRAAKDTTDREDAIQKCIGYCAGQCNGNRDDCNAACRQPNMNPNKCHGDCENMRGAVRGSTCTLAQCQNDCHAIGGSGMAARADVPADKLAQCKSFCMGCGGSGAECETACKDKYMQPDQCDADCDRMAVDIPSLQGGSCKKQDCVNECKAIAGSSLLMARADDERVDKCISLCKSCGGAQAACDSKCKAPATDCRSAADNVYASPPPSGCSKSEFTARCDCEKDCVFECGGDPDTCQTACENKVMNPSQTCAEICDLMPSPPNCPKDRCVHDCNDIRAQNPPPF